MRNLFKYSKFYSGEDPELVEGDIFRIIVPLNENYSFDYQEISENEKPGNAPEKPGNAPEKAISRFMAYYEFFAKKEITEKYMQSISSVYDKVGNDTPFGQSDVQKWLDCSKWKATNIMNIMKNAGIIYQVKDYGSGKYKFIDKNSLS